MSGSENQEKSKGPSTITISIGGIIAFLGLAGSMLATHITTQTDISNLKLGAKLGDAYQKETNMRLSEEIRQLKDELRESVKESREGAKALNEKADRIIENLRARK